MSDQRTSTADSATEPLQADKSLGELFGDLTSDLSRLFRQEVELAKTEARQELKRAGKASVMLAGAGLGGWMALLFVSLGLAWLLDQALNTALAFAIVGVLWALIALVLAASGRKRLATVEALPTTVHSLKEDVEWAKTQKN
jgi:Putative Actinobacterial Holin-X, holin superfamily III